MIKLRNLDNSLVQWIMTATGLGPGIGEIHYLVPAVSSTSQYRSTLNNMNVDDANMHTTPAAAYAALESYRNDVLLVLPAPSHLMTAAITWAKHNTCMLGLAGPNNQADWNTGIRFRTSTEAIAALFDVTGHSVQFHNIAITNHGNYSTNKTALKLSLGHSFYGKGLKLRGARESTQASQTDCCSLLIHSASGGSPEHARFDDCRIGYAKNPAHKGPVISFTGVSANPAVDTEFHNCRISDQIHTANAGGMVNFAVTSHDRYCYFDNCLFYNFNTNWVAKHERVFHPVGGMSTKDIILHNCIAVGFDEWQDHDTNPWVTGDMPDAYTGGGLAEELNTNNAGS